MATCQFLSELPNLQLVAIHPARKGYEKSAQLRSLSRHVLAFGRGWGLSGGLVSMLTEPIARDDGAERESATLRPARDAAPKLLGKAIRTDVPENTL